MLLLISPAKSLDFKTPTSDRLHTQPQFLKQSSALIKELKQLNSEDIQELMGVSQNIANLNFERFQEWHSDFTVDNAKQAALAFQGDVYKGLNMDQFDGAEVDFAQTHLRILSGLYGVLKPMDLIQPYRLEMGTKFQNKKGKNLYEFWGNAITDQLNAELADMNSDVVINLASNEYFKAVKPKQLNASVITPVFKDFKTDKYKIISFYAKKARGMMSAYIIEQGITEPEQIKQFDVAGYQYNADESTANQWVFLRKEAV
ncbi:MAG: peroxide stress protein YaaA [Pseudomonadota bacterium]